MLGEPEEDFNDSQIRVEEPTIEPNEEEIVEFEKPHVAGGIFYTPFKEL